MKKLFLSFIVLFLMQGGADACVGKVLFIGAVNTAQDRLLAEVVSVLINERTGTTVKVRLFESSRELYAAVQKNEIGILIENTDRAAGAAGMRRDEKDYSALKEDFKNRLNLVWLQPAGSPVPSAGSSRNLYVPVITAEVMNNFPALPRVLNKLSGIMNDEGYRKMARTVDAGEEPSRATRDFLKSKKLI
jgi:osmoprotectant transport system substrate-binding protein